MDFSEYQDKSVQTAERYADPIVSEYVEGGMSERQEHALFLATGLNGEAGEVGEKIKKYVREDDDAYLDEARAELGDVLWYLTQLATLLDVDLDDVAEENLDKLLDRQERDQIFGQGDNR